MSITISLKSQNIERDVVIPVEWKDITVKYWGELSTIIKKHYQDAANLMGINLDGVLLFTTILAAFLAGVAAFLYVPLESMHMGSGWDILLLSMSVVILGGMGSILGTVLGAFVLSFSVKFCEFFINPLVGFPLDSIFHLIIIILMLMIRPRGILGKKERI